MLKDENIKAIQQRRQPPRRVSRSSRSLRICLRTISATGMTLDRILPGSPAISSKYRMSPVLTRRGRP